MINKIFRFVVLQDPKAGSFVRFITKFSRFGLILITGLGFTLGSAVAQTNDETAKVIRQLFKANGTDRQHAFIVNLMVESTREPLRAFVADSFAKQPINSDSPEQSRAIINKYFVEYAESTRKAFTEKLPWSKMEDDVLIPMYRKNFSLPELKTALDFHQSAVGKKFQEKQPALQQEFTRNMSELYKPLLSDESKKIADEMLKRLRVELEKAGAK
jgi:hypothetical protein